MAPGLGVLTGEGRAKIAQAVLALLERTGVKLTEPEGRALLERTQARLDGDRVHIPARLVEWAIGTAPRSVALYTRTGEPAMQLGGRRGYFGAHTDAPDVWDPYTQSRRPCREADIGRHAALIDALPNLSYTTASGLVADRPAALADRVSLAQCLENAAKPVLAMPITLGALADCRTMTAAAVGGDDALRVRPVLVAYVEPVSPLVHPDESVRKLFYCAEHEIPVVYSPYAAMGATAPQSLAAITTQLCAESLSGLVLHQLRRPGAPFIFGGMPSLMDMRTTVFSYGAPEFQLGHVMMAQMAHFYDLPCFGTAGTSDAQQLDGQAILEVTSSCLMAALAGANMIHDVGLLGSATVVMPEMIVAGDEIIGMVRRLAGEVAVDDEALALDVIEAVGPGGEFVTQDHTRAHYREAWYPQLLYRSGAKAAADEGPPSFEQRLNARTRELLEREPARPLAAEARREIQHILAQAQEAIAADPS